jgi:hypothetical protein
MQRRDLSIDSRQRIAAVLQQLEQHAAAPDAHLHALLMFAEGDAAACSHHLVKHTGAVALLAAALARAAGAPSTTLLVLRVLLL